MMVLAGNSFENGVLGMLKSRVTLPQVRDAIHRIVSSPFCAVAISIALNSSVIDLVRKSRHEWVDGLCRSKRRKFFGQSVRSPISDCAKLAYVDARHCSGSTRLQIGYCRESFLGKKSDVALSYSMLGL